MLVIPFTRRHVKNHPSICERRTVIDAFDDGPKLGVIVSTQVKLMHDSKSDWTDVPEYVCFMITSEMQFGRKSFWYDGFHDIISFGPFQISCNDELVHRICEHAEKRASDFLIRVGDIFSLDLTEM